MHNEYSKAKIFNLGIHKMAKDRNPDIFLAHSVHISYFLHFRSKVLKLCFNLTSRTVAAEQIAFTIQALGTLLLWKQFFF